MPHTYKIIRRSIHGYRRTIRTGLTLDEAQVHCRDPQTSSRTCTLSRLKKLTQRVGAWFDGYEQEG